MEIMQPLSLEYCNLISDGDFFSQEFNANIMIHKTSMRGNGNTPWQCMGRTRGTTVTQKVKNSMLSVIIAVQRSCRVSALVLRSTKYQCNEHSGGLLSVMMQI